MGDRALGVAEVHDRLDALGLQHLQALVGGLLAAVQVLVHLEEVAQVLLVGQRLGLVVLTLRERLHQGVGGLHGALGGDQVRPAARGQGRQDQRRQHQLLHASLL
ncbi:hypothetical protein D3C72_1925780 [compost metagenome]